MKVEKRDLLVIGKSKSTRCFKGVRSLPVDYYCNANAWMTNVIFNDWLVKWNLELKRKIVLLVDNYTVHTNNSLLKTIKVIFLPAKTTSLIQQCYQGIMRAFKAHYRREICARIIAELDDIRDRSDASAVVKKISLLDALHLVSMSQRRLLKTASEKVDFLKQTLKLLLPKNLILQVKFSIKPQTACQKKNLKIGWILITMLK
jgi:hypothetical protein